MCSFMQKTILLETLCAVCFCHLEAKISSLHSDGAVVYLYQHRAQGMHFETPQRDQQLTVATSTKYAMTLTSLLLNIKLV